MYCMMYLDDISSLIALACVPELYTIEFCPLPIENVLGRGRGAKLEPPLSSTFSMVNGRNSLLHNSSTQQIKLEMSSIYLKQCILGENQGNPTMLHN